MTEQTSDLTPEVSDTATISIVESFLQALQADDFGTAESLLTEDFVWHNVGFPAMRGRSRVMKVFRRGQGRMVFEVKMHRIAADGSAVLTERTDLLVFGPLRLRFWACGTFELRDGRIAVWRDHFDFVDFFLKAPLRGLLGILIPRLRPTL